MQLGTLMGRLAREADAAEALEAIGDIVLYAEIVRTAERFDESPGAYVSAATRRFATSAGDEDWVSLIGAVGAAVERGDDPGHTALLRMTRWALDHDARDCEEGRHVCGCRGGGDHDHT